jgi:ribosome-associated protein
MSGRAALVINDEITIPRDELSFSFVRSSGPGGQNVNKVNTKVVLRWSLEQTTSLPPAVHGRFVARYARRINEAGELLLSSQQHRQQSRNVRDCEAKLRDLILAVAKPPQRRKKTHRPARVNEARLKQKRATAGKKTLRRRPSSDDG